MTHDELAKKTAELGFQFLEPGQGDANKTLAEVLESHDSRFLEAFPVMLANAAESGRFSYDALKSYLQTSQGKKSLDSFLALSLALFDSLKLKHDWSDKYHFNVSKELAHEYSKKVKANEVVTVGNTSLSPDKLKRNLLNYHMQPTQSLKLVVEAQEELGLEFSLSQVFSTKQKELFLKKLRHEKMTKTEKEYFSRVVKKKALALANEDLHRLARKLLD